MPRSSSEKEGRPAAADACIPSLAIQPPPSLPLRTAIVLHGSEPQALWLCTSPTCSHSAGGADFPPAIQLPRPPTHTSDGARCLRALVPGRSLRLARMII